MAGGCRRAADFRAFAAGQEGRRAGAR